MTTTNLELVRSIYSAWQRGDWSSVEWADPGLELVVADGPEPGSWTGLAAAAERWREFLASWEDWRVEVDEYRELDDERMLVLARNTGRGKVSGLDVEQMRAGPRAFCTFATARSSDSLPTSIATARSPT
jgi:hypothetical protein